MNILSGRFNRYKNKLSKDVFSEMLPQAISVLKKTILDPFLGDNIMRKYANEKSPLRAELFSSEQMQQYAIKLAKSHKITQGQLSEKLLKRLSENEGVLLNVHTLLTKTIRQKKRIAPAGEWLLDNFYLIEEQIYTGKKHLPKGYSKELPQLSKGVSEGLPRVYDIAVKIISHSDGRVDLKSLSAFVRSYQTEVTLKLGELWAIPIMLRLALLENLRRLSTQIAVDILNKNQADYWADEMTETAEKDPKNLVLIIADMARSNPPMESSFVAELTRRLQGKGPSLTLALSWIEQRLSENGLTSIEFVNIENQKQAADQMSISNTVNGLRFLNTTDWRDFVESLSTVDHILRNDINRVYEKMDFHTRDIYRHVIEKMAKTSVLTEENIAKLAISFAEKKSDNLNVRFNHVGYYLIGKGLAALEKAAKTTSSFADNLKLFLKKFPLVLYVGAILVGTLFLSLFMLNQIQIHRLKAWERVLLILILIIATSQFSLNFINWVVTLFAKPVLLPRLDLSKGIPKEYKSIIVVPTILINLDKIEALVEALEVRFLANKDKNLHYALLTDFRDAGSESLPEDDELLNFTNEKIIQLNRKYDREKNDIFFLFHRPRKWNPKEQKWMGYERKRGKLAALNGLLRGKGRENFSLIVADESIFADIKYVITLDSDTQLPRDAAWKMIGTIAHPLNTALYDPQKQRVVEGYTILQPRVSNSLASSEDSIYKKIHGNEVGIDPYTHATSDVFQDIFEEGSFIGKGIYDIDAFEQTLCDRFPENRILSHDLLEGCYVRCGLISDVQLYEEYPFDYLTDMQRHKRWVRGDWQIARWLFPLVPSPNKKFRKNGLSALSLWKIFDNLRRSLVSISLLIILIYGWVMPPYTSVWTFCIILLTIAPSVSSLIREVYRKPKGVVLGQHLLYAARLIYNDLIKHALNLIYLPYNAFINLISILKTNWRLFIYRKKLLEWNPSSNSSTFQEKKLWYRYREMWIQPFLGLTLFIYLDYNSLLLLHIEFPILALWIAAPVIEWYMSQPDIKRAQNISKSQTIFLHGLSRKIWYFFETFVSKEDNWLPPDNYQEHPQPRIAHRTSPTNIGLSLLSNLTAYDFGYLSAEKLISRTSLTINTVEKLEKYRGHLYNWYDTISLKPLIPRYISTVDSGNLAGHLIVMKQGLLLIINDKIYSEKSLKGLMDIIYILLEKKENAILIEKFKTQLENYIKSPPVNLAESISCITSLKGTLAEITSIPKPSEKIQDSFYLWIEKLNDQLNDQFNDLTFLAPWLLLKGVPSKFSDAIKATPSIPTLSQLAKMDAELIPLIKSLHNIENTAEENDWIDNYVTLLKSGSLKAIERISKLELVAKQCIEQSNIEYDFLYDKSQHLLAIGYNADENRRDNSYYDLLASEARLTTFTAIAQGKLPQESWFSLGRQLLNSGSKPILLSWSGSMFEYLMPLLVMPTYEHTLLDQTCKAVVEKQIEYGRKRKVSWGVSESGYNAVDVNLNYQYHAFGIPGLGFKRGLGEDLVISPYSSLMALMVLPVEACKNLEELESNGFEGEFGFYEAIDYTPSRLPRGQTNVVIRSFMVHHQGMSLLSLSYLLLKQPMQKRFEAEVQFQATLLLLQEKIPRVSTYYAPVMHESDTSMLAENDDLPLNVINTPHTPVPEVQLLSNGRYHLMVTNAGGGYSRWKDIAVTRWREDSTCDNWGTFCFIRDLEHENKIFWSAAYQPSHTEGENYEAVFSQGRAEFRRRDYLLETHMEIVVSPEDDVELRRVHITNRSRKKRFIEITSYAEVVLASPASDIAHPAFSNLFVQTEIIAKYNAIICTRRPRSEDEKNPSVFHLMKVYNADIHVVTYETDRSQFIGRCETIHEPAFLNRAEGLSGSEGSVLDPIVSIQYRILINPQETATIDMLIGIAETRDLCNALVEKYQDRYLRNRALELSWTHSQVVLRQINASESDAQLFSKIGSSVIFSNPFLRTDPGIILKNHRGQSALWSYSISGDLPIVLLQIEDSTNIDLVRQLIQAHAYWRLKGLMVDLVIWNEDRGGYRQALQNEIQNLIAPILGTEVKEQPGGIFIRSAEQISSEDRILFQTLARIVISDKLGSLEEQVKKSYKVKNIIPNFSPTKLYPYLATAIPMPNEMDFYNGIGGFSKDGKEYVIVTDNTHRTPAPWINVLANANFGTIVSENGQSYTWLENAHEFRLTPWNNDPVTDASGEAFYLRDEENGKFWSPLPLPGNSKSRYVTTHGFGYSLFQHSEDGIDSEVCVFVDLTASVKFIIIKLKNKSKRLRKLSVTGYMEWVLGDHRSKTKMHIITKIDAFTGSILAKNPYNTEFEKRIAFFDVDDPEKNFTTDRTEFIGRNGTLGKPEVMSKAKLSGKAGAALDPCASFQVMLDLEDNEEKETIFRLGAVKENENLSNTIQGYKTDTVAHEALKKVKEFWQQTLGVLQIETPDKALNIISNGWLNYQALACRIWGRSGFYQSGGAFGFRDQLQDILSLLYSKPAIARNQILLNASRQFKEGDVQHWWHPPTGRGVRTSCSDDFLWLPFATIKYVTVTQDKSILNESIHFLEGRPLNIGEESYFDLPFSSNDTASLYDHCKKSIEHALKFGDHGLPLMGSGDWNDGMDKVGIHGKGESIWLAFFLYDILFRFKEIAQIKEDSAFQEKCSIELNTLKLNIESHAWDGQWYRRAYFDDGTPLGSAINEECKIDSIVQSWAVLSGGGDLKRAQTGMNSAENHLVRKESGLIQLFDPAFDKSNLNPGYIKGYVPGVRENGGQYTHAAIWLIMAFAELKNKEKTWELLQMVNPVNHGGTAEGVTKYKVEPYVMAADLYADPLHKSRGGWTWYTGSAGWMYQLIIENFLGFKCKGNRLEINPCIPAEWNSFNIKYKFIDTLYDIKVMQNNTDKQIKLLLDEQPQPNQYLLLTNDGRPHTVIIVLGKNNI
ncbi:MAG: glucoamylase family protein [Flavisolibacter sp.]